MSEDSAYGKMEISEVLNVAVNDPELITSIPRALTWVNKGPYK
jgi:hypothetical protein